MTKLGAKRVHQVRCRGGNIKFRAMRLDTGNISWGTEVNTQRVHVLDVVYNASNNELVRTKTLVKGAIVLVDAKPFQTWYQNHYGVEIGKKKNKGVSKFPEEFVSCLAPAAARAATALSCFHVFIWCRMCGILALANPLRSQAEKHPLKHEATAKKFAERQKTRVLAPSLDDQFSNGRMLARLTSRPGQTGRLDGYVLEGRELDFYVKKLAVKKSKK
jgi:small subunit ribosomal protein S8e